MRAQELELQEISHILDHSPRNFASSRRRQTNRVDAGSPSHRHRIGGERTREFRRRLRHSRSSDTVAGRAASVNVRRRNSTRSGNGAVSAFGFRESEGLGNIELGSISGATGLGISTDGGETRRAPQPYEVPQTERGNESRGLRKKRSVERWREVGVGWLKRGGGGNRGERDV